MHVKIFKYIEGKCACKYEKKPVNIIQISNNIETYKILCTANVNIYSHHKNQKTHVIFYFLIHNL